MALCDLCGEKASWLQNRHLACNEWLLELELKKPLRDLIFNGMSNGQTYEALDREVQKMASSSKLPLIRFQEQVLQAVNDAAAQLAQQEPISADEFERLVAILRGFSNDSYTTESVQRRWFGMPILGMSLILWQVLHNIQPYYDGDGRMQFNLQSGEEPFFTAGKVVFAQERTAATHPRTFASLSIPIGGGMYYRVGASEGYQQQSSGLLPLDIGEMLITNRSLYFGGQKKTVRIALNHGVRYQPYMDAVGVCEANGGAPNVFVPDYNGMDTGWFFFNLLSALTAKLN
jgi:hypothetical protein